MSSLRSNKHAVTLLQIAGIAAIIFLLSRIQGFAGTFVGFSVSKILIYTTFGMSLYIVMGLGGLPSLAQVSIGGIASYVLALGRVYWGWSWFQAAIAGILFVMAVALVFSIFSMNCSNVAFMMMTMCLANLISQCALTWTELTRGYNGINGIKGPEILGMSFANSRTFYYLIVIIVPICYFLIKRLSMSPFGIAVQGMRDNSVKAESMGFNTRLLRIVLFTISGFYSAVGGVLMATFYSQMNPTNLGNSMSLLCLIILVIGGTRFLEGAFVGSVIYIIFENYMGEITLYYKSLLGILFLICVFVIPNGVLSLPVFRKKFWTRLGRKPGRSR